MQEGTGTCEGHDLQAWLVPGTNLACMFMVRFACLPHVLAFLGQDVGQARCCFGPFSSPGPFCAPQCRRDVITDQEEEEGNNSPSICKQCKKDKKEESTKKRKKDRSSCRRFHHLRVEPEVLVIIVPEVLFKIFLPKVPSSSSRRSS